MTQLDLKRHFEGLEKAVSNERKVMKEISGLFGGIGGKKNPEDKMALRQVDSLKSLLKKENERVLFFLEKISVAVPMSKGLNTGVSSGSGDLVRDKNKQDIFDKFIHGGLHSYKNIKLNRFEKETLKRLKKRGETVVRKKEKKPNFYISLSNKLLSEFSAKLIERGMFKSISINLIKSNMEFLPKSYVSVILFTTLVSFVVSVFLYAFFVIFTVQAGFPFITQFQGSLLARILSLTWIPIAVPSITFLFMYMYPSLEKGSIEGKIDQELPFAAINMAAISGSMIDPTKLFEIIISTREYPAMEKEFGKIVNGVNVLGYDLISVLRNSAFTTPSKNLADLFNGIATTINTGGDLPKFFDERAKTLLFEYNLEKEKSTKAAETFMDIYISVVIAAPMILMLLLIIMQVSGLGFSLTTTMITLVMVLGVSLINAVFLAFLHIKQSSEA